MLRWQQVQLSLAESTFLTGELGFSRQSSNFTNQFIQDQKTCNSTTSAISSDDGTSGIQSDSNWLEVHELIRYHPAVSHFTP
jgi:hypothetical protein